MPPQDQSPKTQPENQTEVSESRESLVNEKKKSGIHLRETIENGREKAHDWFAGIHERSVEKALETTPEAPKKKSLARILPKYTILTALIVVLVVGGLAVGALALMLYQNLDRSLVTSAQVLVQNYSNPESVSTLDALSAQEETKRAGKGPRRRHRPPPPGTLWARGALAETIHIVIDGQNIKAGRLKADMSVDPLEDDQVAKLRKEAKPDPTSVSIPGLKGMYRVVKVGAKTADGHPIQMIVGVPLLETQRILVKFTLWGMLFVALALTLAYLLNRRIVRRQLLPLTLVTRVANSVTQVKLEENVQLPARVPVSLTVGESESAQVGRALNAALDHIQAGLTEREKSEERLRQFVSDASHELRTPVATISGYAQLLAKTSGEQLDEQQTKCLERINSEANRMGVLVGDLLQLARLDEGQSLDTKPVDLAALAVDAVADAHISAPAWHWQAYLPEDPTKAANLIVDGDEMKLRQVIANLLANAKQHTPQGTQVCVKVGQASEKTIFLEVADNGPGIAPELGDKIFDRFARADSARTPGESSGLGLAIVKAIVQAHGGKIRLLETAGGGATFRIELPRKR